MSPLSAIQKTMEIAYMIEIVCIFTYLSPATRTIYDGCYFVLAVVMISNGNRHKFGITLTVYCWILALPRLPSYPANQSSRTKNV